MSEAAQSPTMMPLRNAITRDEVDAACPGSRPIYVCDFYIQDAEQGELTHGGLDLGRILNVDHHAPLRAMESSMTSTRLAYDHLRTRDGGVGGSARWVVINHTDCDSMLSSAMLMGLVRPSHELVDASVCADHTGEENAVADLLQALDEGRQGDRTEAQYSESLRNLQLLLAGGDPEPRAAEALRSRRERRTAAKALVEQGLVVESGGLAVGVLEKEIDGAFFPALLPNASVIMLAKPHPTARDHWLMKLRLGKAAAPGLTLHALSVADWDSNYGGRWNAGSNKRGGGVHMDPLEYAGRLRQRLEARH